MSKKILILVPSRDGGSGRVVNVERLIKSWKDTTSGSSDLTIVADYDEWDIYGPIAKDIGLFIQERRNLCPKLNAAAITSAEYYDIISFMGDDCVFQTKGWEEEIIAWQDKNKGICYCNDLLQGEILPNNVFIWSDIIRALGFMCPPELQHYYIDNFWKDLGIRLGRIEYFSNIIIEHRHWSNGKAEKDKLYTDSEFMMGPDRLAFDTYRHLQFDQDIEKIKKLL